MCTYAHLSVESVNVVCMYCMYVVDAMDGHVKKAANNSLLTHIPSLSAQELVDCDGEFNQVIKPRHIHVCMYVCADLESDLQSKGCSGGNPFYAFDYVLNYGLVGWNDYPYAETVRPFRNVYVCIYRSAP